jgi:DNA replication protein DnaC
MRSSRLPAVKQLRDFDFTFQPSLRREQIESLHELGFVERRENVIFLGPPEPATYCSPSLLPRKH